MLSARLNLWLCAVLLGCGQVASHAQLFLAGERSPNNSPDPGEVALGWNPSPDTRATGYFLCWGLASTDCTNFLDVGNVTNATVAGLVPNVGYYFTIVTYDAAGDQSPPSNQITAIITPADPVVTTWPKASAITYGQTLAASTLSGGSATPAGTFAFTTPSTAPNAGSALQSVTYTPTDTTYYNTASSTVSVTVNKADPSVTAWPVASAITYGQTLGTSTLSGGSATPAGTFVFTTPSTAPNAGTALQSVTYTPTDTADYNTASSTVSVTVNKADPSVTAWPVASAITYGQTLAASTLSGGSATPAGSFAFTTPSAAPNAGTALQSVTYTPTDTTDYNTASSTASVTVNPKALTVTGITANDKVYDGNTTATLNTSGVTLVGIVPMDVVTLNTAGATGAFTDPDVGTAKTVLVSGFTLSGADAGNYTLIQPTTTANITQASSATALVSSANPSLQGSNVTFTATVTPVAPASTTPTGNVQFYTNGVAWGSPVALTDGVVSLSAADLPPGTNTVLAAYLGDSDFLGSSNSLAQVVPVVPATPRTIGIQNNAGGTVTITFAGTPDAQYVVQASDNLAPPAWENVSTNTAGTDGQWTFTESTEHHPVRLYRSARP